MKAAIYEGPKKIRVTEVERPGLPQGGMVIRVESCAICGTDLKIYHHGNPRVKPPQIIGHEFVGTIVEKDEKIKDFRIGDRITMATSISCGRCAFCNQGLNNLCNSLTPISCDFPGAFAEYMAIPAQGIAGGNVLRVPDNLSSDEGALSEPLGCVINGQMIADVGLGNTVVVIGAGPIGCLHVEAARARGATKIILTEISQARLEMASAFDVDALVNVSQEDPVSRVLDLTKGLGADVVIVAAPSNEAQEQSLQMARKNGVVNLFASLPTENPYLKINSRLIHYNQISLTGASDSTPYHQRMALNMLSSGMINTQALITHRFGLTDFIEGLNILQGGKGLKIIIHPGEEK